MATILKRGKRWQAKVRRCGYPEQSKNFSTKADAQQWARETELAMDRGSWVDTSEARRTTLTEAIERYAREVTPTKKGAPQEANRLRRWGQHRIGKTALANVRSADIAEIRDQRLKEASPATVRNDLAALSAVFEHARKEWRMEALTNPVRALRRPAPSRQRDRRLEAGEEQALYAAASSPVQRAYLTLALETGMRRGEIIAMRWQYINLPRRIIHLPETKTDEARDVPLSTAAVRALQSLPRRIDGKVWPWSNEGASSMWRRWIVRAGIEDLRFHDLRHEATSRFIESGRFEITEVMAITLCVSLPSDSAKGKTCITLGH
ncbi:tyrosine-type recombinase/integrase [Halorhodospira neutriphila]|uniref:Phage integrase family protein n=1 Tax=Halorhodospira neutriphila TaxID=168379 RepID=A0ABS1E7Z5_9GAMM|nr:site-specific integrase [Halorhodospira neutriphila]MBK1727302.1 hypothetical protein [Halorhodospira neutriphila]